MRSDGKVGKMGLRVFGRYVWSDFHPECFPIVSPHALPPHRSRLDLVRSRGGGKHDMCLQEFAGRGSIELARAWSCRGQATLKSHSLVRVKIHPFVPPAGVVEKWSGVSHSRQAARNAVNMAKSLAGRCHPIMP
jgi:hypothetical protein